MVEAEENKDTSKIGFLLKNVSWLMLGRFVAKIMALLFLPIVTAYLDPKSYGIIALFQAEAALLSGVFGLGLSVFAARMIYKYERRNPKICSQYIGVILFYLIIFGLLGVSLCSPFSKGIARLFIKDIDGIADHIFYIPLFYAFFMGIHGFFVNNFISLQQNKKLFLVETLEFLLIFPLQVIGLIWFGFTWIEVVVLQLVSKIIVTFYDVWLIRGTLGFSFKRLKIIKQALKFSLPYVPLKFVSVIQTSIDKILLGNLTSISNVGIYSVGNKLSEGFSHFSRPIMIAIKPEISKRLDSKAKNLEEDITEFFNMYFKVSVLMIFAVSIFSREILSVLADEKFFQAFTVIPLLMFSYMNGEASGIFSLKILYKNKTGIFPIVTFFSVALNIGLNVLLIPRYKMIGAAFATFLTSYLTFVIYYVISQRVSKSFYNLKSNFLMFAFLFLIIIAQNMFHLSLTMILVKLAIISLFSFILFKYLNKKYRRFREIKSFIFLKIKKVFDRPVQAG